MTSKSCLLSSLDGGIAVFPVLADAVEVKAGARSTAHWPIPFIRLNGWPRHNFAQLIPLLDIDGIGQNWEDSNRVVECFLGRSNRALEGRSMGAIWELERPAIKGRFHALKSISSNKSHGKKRLRFRRMYTNRLQTL